MADIKRIIITFSKAQCSAWIATAVDFSVTILLSQIFSVWYVVATFLGAVSGGVTNCTINYRWVFHAFGMKKMNVAIRYMMVWVGSILLNTYGTYFLTELTKFPFLIIKIVVAVIVAVLWNYQLQYSFVFPRRKRKKNQVEKDGLQDLSSKDYIRRH